MVRSSLRRQGKRWHDSPLMLGAFLAILTVAGCGSGKEPGLTVTAPVSQPKAPCKHPPCRCDSLRP